MASFGRSGHFPFADHSLHDHGDQYYDGFRGGPRDHARMPEAHFHPRSHPHPHLHYLNHLHRHGEPRRGLFGDAAMGMFPPFHLPPFAAVPDMRECFRGMRDPMMGAFEPPLGWLDEGSDEEGDEGEFGGKGYAETVFEVEEVGDGEGDDEEGKPGAVPLSKEYTDEEEDVHTDRRGESINTDFNPYANRDRGRNGSLDDEFPPPPRHNHNHNRNSSTALNLDPDSRTTSPNPYIPTTTSPTSTSPYHTPHTPDLSTREAALQAAQRKLALDRTALEGDRHALSVKQRELRDILKGMREEKEHLRRVRQGLEQEAGKLRRVKWDIRMRVRGRERGGDGGMGMDGGGSESGMGWDSQDDDDDEKEGWSSQYGDEEEDGNGVDGGLEDHCGWGNGMD